MECAGRRLQSPHPAGSEDFTGWEEQTPLWLPNCGDLGCSLVTCLSSQPCSMGVAGREVSCAAGVCSGPGRALQFWGSAGRLGERNPAGYMQAAWPVCSWGVQPGDLPKTSGVQ